jgi:ABC-type glycerol-3-phosphate transport system substrate-binding protein
MLNKADEGQVIATSSAPIGVASDGDNKEAALEFIRFLYKDENMAKFAKYSEALPSTNVDLSDVELSETTKRAQAILADPQYKHVTVNLAWGSVDAVMVDVINQIVLGELDVDGAINELVKAVEKKLDE